MNDKQIRVAVHQKLFRHYSATPNTLILVLRDAVEVPVGAEENLTVGNGWRRVARLAQVIHGQKFELLRIGPKPLGPPDFSGLAFHTLSGPWSGVDYEDESINDHTRANPCGLSLQPQPVGSGHVAGSAQLETNRGSVSPSRERDADSGGDYGRSIDQINFFFRQSLERRVFGPPGSSYFQSSLPVFKSSAVRKARSPGPKFKMTFPRWRIGEEP